MNNNYLTPKEIANKWVEIGKQKANYPFITVLLLSIMGGFFIALGGHGYLVVSQTLGNIDVGLAKFMGAAVFPVGLMLVVIAGGELYTGNALISTAWAQGDVKLQSYIKNLVLVYLANLIGALLLVAMLYKSGLYTGHLAEKTIAIAEGKVSLSFDAAIIRGILCNVLVAGAVYIQVASKDLIGKIFAMWFPVMLFVLSGYEHSVANMFFIPLGKFLGGNFTWSEAILHNFIPVTIGNLIGGGLFIGLVYWAVYVRGKK